MSNAADIARRTKDSLTAFREEAARLAKARTDRIMESLPKEIAKALMDKQRDAVAADEITAFMPVLEKTLEDYLTLSWKEQMHFAFADGTQPEVKLISVERGTSNAVFHYKVGLIVAGSRPGSGTASAEASNERVLVQPDERPMISIEVYFDELGKLESSVFVTANNAHASMEVHELESATGQKTEMVLLARKGPQNESLAKIMDSTISASWAPKSLPALKQVVTPSA